jgi:glycerol kinase
LLDGIAFQCAEIVRAIAARLERPVCEIRADGGPTRNEFLMQRQADLLGVPVGVSLEPDMTALGAALLAALGADALSMDDMAQFQPARRQFEPQLAADAREMLWHDWRRSVVAVCERAEA